LISFFEEAALSLNHLLEPHLEEPAGPDNLLRRQHPQAFVDGGLQSLHTWVRGLTYITGLGLENAPDGKVKRIEVGAGRSPNILGPEIRQVGGHPLLGTF